MAQVLRYIAVLTAVLQLAGAWKESTAGPGTAGGRTVQPTSAETSARAALMGESEGTTHGVVTVVPTTEAGTTVQATLSGTSTYTTLQPDVDSTESEPEGTTNGIATVVPTIESSVVDTSVHTDFAETTAHTTPRPGVSTEDELEGTTNAVVTVVPTTEATIGLDRELGTTDGITTEASPDVVVVVTEYSELSTSEPDVMTAVSIKYAEASAATTEVGSAARSTFLATPGPTTPQPQTWDTTSFSPATNSPETPSTPTTPVTGTTEQPCTYWVLCQPRRPVESLTTRATTTTNSTTHATTTTNSTTHATTTTNSTTHATTTTNSTKGTSPATGTPANAGNGCAFWFFCGNVSVEPPADSLGDLSHQVTSSSPENIFTQPSQRTAVETTREASTRPAEACALWWEWQCAVEHSTLLTATQHQHTHTPTAATHHPTATIQHPKTPTAATNLPIDPTTTPAVTGRRPCNFWLGQCGPNNRVPPAETASSPAETQTNRCWYCLFSQHGNR
ncbi:Y' element ATP-dependent helicase YJL225C-like [Branchiostoma floridae]|uniref:Y' element ATP-dependent helicase YJL225C-like n=1 Tax=Branchiostoma floridae TaxID=7739 RepID=A0A9J7HVL4_BRAFL|nr:Y' element ATP-dependent helicase YJL225C-like [Branchiostoma floridae]